MRVGVTVLVLAVWMCGLVVVKADSEEVTDSPPPLVEAACAALRKRIEFTLAAAYKFKLPKFLIEKLMQKFIEPILPEPCAAPAPEEEAGSEAPPTQNSLSAAAEGSNAVTHERRKRSEGSFDHVSDGYGFDSERRFNNFVYPPFPGFGSFGQLPFLAPGFRERRYAHWRTDLPLNNGRNLSSHWLPKLKEGDIAVPVYPFRSRTDNGAATSRDNLIRQRYHLRSQTGKDFESKRVRRSDGDDFLNHDIFTDNFPDKFSGLIPQRFSSRGLGLRNSFPGNQLFARNRGFGSQFGNPPNRFF